MSLLVELLAAERRRDLECETALLQRIAALRRAEPQPDPADRWTALLRRYRAAVSA
jgi:hypothetical protein